MSTNAAPTNTDKNPESARDKVTKAKPIDDSPCVPSALSHVDPARWAEWAERGVPSHIGVRLAASAPSGDKAAAVVEPLAQELNDLLGRHEPVHGIEVFLTANDSWARRLERLAALRCLELLDNIDQPAVPFPGWAPDDDPHLRSRVLNLVEESNLWLASRASERRRSVLGLLSETATSGEVAGTPRDSFEEDANSGVLGVLLPGVASARGGVAIEHRYVELPHLAQPTVRALLRRHDDLALDTSDHWVIRSKHPVGAQPLADAVGMVLVDLLRAAGLKGDPTVEPMSIRNTAGRRIYDEHGLEVAAARMGMRNRIDDLRQQIGLRRRPPIRRRS